MLLCGLILKLDILVPILVNQEWKPCRGQFSPPILGWEGQSLEQANSLSIDISNRISSDSPETPREPETKVSRGWGMLYEASKWLLTMKKHSHFRNAPQISPERMMHFQLCLKPVQSGHFPFTHSYWGYAWEHCFSCNFQRYLCYQSPNAKREKSHFFAVLKQISQLTVCKISICCYRTVFSFCTLTPLWLNASTEPPLALPHLPCQL